MSYSFLGYDLPTSTFVYVYAGQYTVLKVKSNKYGFAYLKYHFNLQDELYATESVREYWKRYPEKHPHATLFEILYKKLEIGNTL